DFCEPARRALAFARLIARRRSEPLRAVHVLNLTDSDLTGPGDASQRSFTAAHDSAERALREIRRELRLAGIENAATLISAGQPAAALRQLVQQHEPSLLVLGLNGAGSRNSPDQETRPGTTTLSLLAAPPCSILTVNQRCPQTPAADALERVMIVIDATAKSLRAALDIWPPDPTQPSPTILAVLAPGANSKWELPADLRRRFLLTLARDHAKAADTVQRHVSQAGVGLIIAAFGSESPLSSLTRGALAHSLLTQASCPVLTLRT
ncbi:MAG: universal stress protein, partial [Acidobacteriaceae bacterium]